MVKQPKRGDNRVAKPRAGASRRPVLFAAVLALFAIGSTPTRRDSNGGCNGFSGCGPATNPRSLAVTTPDWTGQTVLPNGAVSWDIGFQRTNSAAHAEQHPPAPYKIQWAGDATSTLVMMRDSTDRSCTLSGGEFTGLIAGSQPYTYGLTQYLYTEVDWWGITGKTNVSTGSPAANFDTTYFALFVECGDSVRARSEREPGAAHALGTPDTIPSCGRRDRRAG